MDVEPAPSASSTSEREEEFEGIPLNDEVNDESNNEDSNNEYFDSDIDNQGGAPRYPWENRILFPQSGLTVTDTAAMARGFSLRFGL